jgi:osmotically-inducible protein OsmY
MVKQDTQSDSDLNQNTENSEADERLRKEIYKLLEAQPQIDTSKLEVRVENCEAILVGVVQSEEQRSMLEDLVASVQGVTDVQDALDLATDIREQASRTIAQEDQQPSAPM